MSKFYCLILSFLIGFSLHSQNFFEWSAGGQGTSIYFQHIVADDQGVVALASSNEVNYVNSQPQFLQAGGEASQLLRYSLNFNGQVLIFFNKEGKIVRVHEFYDDEIKIHGLVQNANKQLVLLTDIEAYEYNDEQDWPTGTLSTFTGREPQPSGFNLVFLTRTGDFVKSVSVKNVNVVDLKVFNFEFHPNGSFVLAGSGSPGKLLINAEEEFMRGGGDFVMMLDTTGQVLWTDIISYRLDMCCSRVSQNTSLSIAPNGVIYFGGNYLNGAIFSNGIQTLTPKKYSEINNNLSEAYVVCYSEKGKIDWVKVYEEQSLLLALQASRDGVFVAHKAYADVAFGERIDTTGAKLNGLSYISKKGKTKWTNMFGFYKINNLLLQGEEMLALYTAENFNMNQTFKINETKLPENTQLAIGSISQKGNMKILKTTNIRFETQHYPLFFTQNLKGESFMAGTIWFSGPVDLPKYEASLPAVECYGGSPILGTFNVK